jgi:hypothetical protein
MISSRFTTLGILDALKLLIERVERSPEYKKASGLLQMMEQMRRLVGGAQKSPA